MLIRSLALLLLAAVSVGCGSTKSRTATEQLLASDAVDAAIAQVDFTPLEGQKVFFDRNYITNDKSTGFVNCDYVVSAIRQQIISSGCLLQDSKEDADFIIEGRIGALGTNSHDIIYGLPANNLLNAAASVVPSPAGAVAPLPTIPEISLAKKNDQIGAAKLGLFAYHRESKQRVWQSGTALARSDAKDMWFFGAGPFQSGSVYGGLRFAGTRLNHEQDENDLRREAELSHFREATVFNPAATFQEPTAYATVEEEDASIVPAGGETPAEK
ncbi:MAG: hypothetical protein KF861_02255 [Planctomycetaceae bacterium]|nr:hypothetical protein [Planctomycetaceae bacterium]